MPLHSAVTEKTVADGSDRQRNSSVIAKRTNVHGQEGKGCPNTPSGVYILHDSATRAEDTSSRPLLSNGEEYARQAVLSTALVSVKAQCLHPSLFRKRPSPEMSSLGPMWPCWCSRRSLSSLALVSMFRNAKQSSLRISLSTWHMPFTLHYGKRTVCVSIILPLTYRCNVGVATSLQRRQCSEFTQSSAVKCLHTRQ